TCDGAGPLLVVLHPAIASAAAVKAERRRTAFMSLPLSSSDHVAHGTILHDFRCMSGKAFPGNEDER
ncbi:MAG TPA: hypothetical protein VI381_03775, partial [Allosphingosinicella sp.]